jgi:uncharacterized OB-fold protein
MSAIPAMSIDSRPHWQGFEQGEIRLPVCTDCGKPHLPPGPVCPFCLSDALEWRVASGRGRVSTFAIVRRPYFRDFPPPYVFCQVELEEGPRLAATLKAGEAVEIRVGMPVWAGFERFANGMVLPVFRPAEA